MTDRELLKLAAKAANMEVSFDLLQWEKYWVEGFGFWNPLTDDGQALQLAVKLRLMISCHESEKVIVIWWRDGIRSEIVLAHDNKNGNDPWGFVCQYAATRRAIVRAAAEIGKETA